MELDRVGFSGTFARMESAWRVRRRRRTLAARGFAWGDLGGNWGRHGFSAGGTVEDAVRGCLSCA